MNWPAHTLAAGLGRGESPGHFRFDLGANYGWMISTSVTST